MLAQSIELQIVGLNVLCRLSEETFISTDPGDKKTNLQ